MACAAATSRTGLPTFPLVVVQAEAQSEKGGEELPYPVISVHMVTYANVRTPLGLRVYTQCLNYGGLAKIDRMEKPVLDFHRQHVPQEIS